MRITFKNMDKSTILDLIELIRQNDPEDRLNPAISRLSSFQQDLIDIMKTLREVDGDADVEKSNTAQCPKEMLDKDVEKDKYPCCEKTLPEGFKRTYTRSVYEDITEASARCKYIRGVMQNIDHNLNEMMEELERAKKNV